MPLESAMKRAAAELWDGLLQAVHNVIERHQGAAPELDDDGLLGFRQDWCYGAGVAPSVHRR